MDKSLIAALILLPLTAWGQTHTMPGSNVVPSGASLTIQSGGTITAASGIKLTAVTVATLPTSPSIGQIASVSDGTAALAWGATVTGGGSTKYLVWYNGANWTVVGK